MGISWLLKGGKVIIMPLMVCIIYKESRTMGVFVMKRQIMSAAHTFVGIRKVCGSLMKILPMAKEDMPSTKALNHTHIFARHHGLYSKKMNERLFLIQKSKFGIIQRVILLTQNHKKYIAALCNQMHILT